MKLHKFGSVKHCHACGAPTDRAHTRFSKTDKGNQTEAAGAFVDLSNIGSDAPPHLERFCTACDYGWLEETKTPIPVL